MNAKLEAMVDRLMAKVEFDESGCWLWTAATQRSGYGYMRDANRRMRVARRLAWEASVGPVPEGQVLDHLCRTRACINPDHLEPVTERENILRGVAPTAQNARKTHCPRGHVHDAVDSRGRRICTICKHEQNVAYGRARARRASGDAA